MEVTSTSRPFDFANRSISFYTECGGTTWIRGAEVKDILVEMYADVNVQAVFKRYVHRDDTLYLRSENAEKSVDAQPGILYLNESGIYSLALLVWLQSRHAKTHHVLCFVRWVANMLVPSIRKLGHDGMVEELRGRCETAKAENDGLKMEIRDKTTRADRMERGVRILLRQVDILRRSCWAKSGVSLKSGDDGSTKQRVQIRKQKATGTGTSSKERSDDEKMKLEIMELRIESIVRESILKQRDLELEDTRNLVRILECDLQSQAELLREKTLHLESLQAYVQKLECGEIRSQFRTTESNVTTTSERVLCQTTGESSSLVMTATSKETNPKQQKNERRLEGSRPSSVIVDLRKTV